MPAPSLTIAASSSAGVATFDTKTDALNRRRALRGKGIMAGEPTRANNSFVRFWVIAAADHRGRTLLLRGDNQWVPGETTDDGPRWRPSFGGPVALPPEHRTHLSRGWVGVMGGFPRYDRDGREVEQLAYDVHAWCVACKWATHDSHDDTVAAAAAYHRKAHAPLELGAVVRYHGSITAQHGTYVVADIEDNARYRLVDPDYPDFGIRYVGRDSITATDRHR